MIASIFWVQYGLHLFLVLRFQFWFLGAGPKYLKFYPHFQMTNYLHLCCNAISLYPNYKFQDVTSIPVLRIVTSHDFEFRKGHLRLLCVAIVPSSAPWTVHKMLLLPCHVDVNIPSTFFPSDFPTKIFHQFSCLPCLPHIILQFINLMTLEQYKIQR